MIFEKFEAGDIKRTYRLICRLREEEWSNWNISADMKEILTLSQKLRNDRKGWKTEGHWNRNRNRVVAEEGDGKCMACAHLEDSQKCVQYHRVRERIFTEVLQNKLVLPDGQVMISPLV